MPSPKSKYVMPTGNAEQVLAQFHGKYGKAIGGFDSQWQDMPRLPTGVFALDIASGGGWPMGAISCVYGGESCGKTTLLLLGIAEFQKRHPHLKSVLIDIEGTTNKQFAEMWGVDWSRLIHLIPEFGEDAIDMAQAMLRAPDVGFLGVDSIAFLTQMGEAEIEAEAEKDLPGRGGILGKKLINKMMHGVNTARVKEGRNPVVLLVNQPRYQIGQVYGNPERLPGGAAQRFAYTLMLRLWGKAVIESQYHATLPCIRETQGRIVKNKVPVVGLAFEYRLALLPHKGLQIGQCDDWGMLKGFLQQLGELKKGKEGWTSFGRTFASQQALRDTLYTDVQYADTVRQAVRDFVESSGGMVPPDDNAGQDAAL